MSQSKSHTKQKSGQIEVNGFWVTPSVSKTNQKDILALDVPWPIAYKWKQTLKSPFGALL